MRNYLIIAVCLLFSACTSDSVEESGLSSLIVNASVIDGTGVPAKNISVRITGDRIVGLGNLSPLAGEKVVDAAGLVLSPGFIDTHSHHDINIQDAPDALAAVSQGITTIVIGQDGGSHHPLGDYWTKLNASPVALNIATYVGHNSLRAAVMGNNANRLASPEEIAEMAKRLTLDMKEGALGLSTGLEYESGIYSSPAEVLALAKVTAKLKGRYISHIRNEAETFESALEEIISIGQQASLPVQISHIKLARRGLWGKADKIIERLNRARAQGVDITADIYPYTYWASTLTVLFPKRDYTNKQSAEYALTELTTAEGMTLSLFAPQPEWVGKTIAEIAQLRGIDTATAYMDLIQQSLDYKKELGANVSDIPIEVVIGVSMVEDDIDKLMVWPHTNICSDGTLKGGHPRGHGAFPRVLSLYSREKGVLTLPQAIHKMTGLTAQHMGFEGRGVIMVGAYADLVLFDPRLIQDQATMDNPDRVSTGLSKVWVNGQQVYSGGKTTGLLPGQLVRRL